MALDGTKLVYYDALLSPVNDTDPSGGAINPLVRVSYAQFNGASKFSLQSDGADTRTVALVGQSDTGAELSENVVLTGATQKESVNTYRYQVEVLAATTDAARTVTVRQGLDGIIRGTIYPGEQGYRRKFRGAVSSPTVPVPRYEKLFLKNTSTTNALLAPAGGSAQVALTDDPAGRLKYALENSLDGTGQVSNRTLAPGGLVFLDGNLFSAIIGGSLAPGAAQGIWLEQLLGVNDVAFWASFIIQAKGDGGV